MKDDNKILAEIYTEMVNDNFILEAHDSFKPRNYYRSGILLISKDTKKALLGLRAKFLREPNTWGILGGIPEHGENLEDAAKREAIEETGYTGTIDNLTPLFLYQNPTKDGGTFNYQNYMGFVDKEFEAIPDSETQKFSWMTFDELINTNNLHPGVKSLLNDPPSFKKIKQHMT